MVTPVPSSFSSVDFSPALVIVSVLPLLRLQDMFDDPLNWLTVNIFAVYFQKAIVDLNLP
jgi:hypothetical protein